MTSRPTLELDFVTGLSTSSRKMQTVFDSLLRQRGLTLARARALVQISRNPGINQSELAKILAIESPTMVRLLDGMEKQDLIQRGASAGDRRAKQLSLTETARSEVQQIEALSRVVGGFMLRGVDEADLGIALRVLGRVVENIEAAMDGHVPS
ncbi:MarR family winged helix-turn-helix transcriptional regulator [Bosea sp. (in: a-proteobacteria)]|jgi:MarR family transcriptional regulator for hemolysin|uniref:MarR family winged helix-turn-helix transcriptional regulator n=1 Tax=Bosea sp. (in: a-proteobacteria) TaxID=1871050 RepID=UPI003F6FF55D